MSATSSFDGVTQDGATSKIGLSVSAGLLKLTRANTYTGPTMVSAGTLLINGSITTAQVDVINCGTLGGTGTINSFLTNIGNGGHLALGAGPGVLNVGRNQLLEGSNFDVKITGAAAGQFDQANVTGVFFPIETTGVGVALHVTKFGDLSLASGTEFVILKNDGSANALPGTFAGLPEGTNLGSNFLGSGLTAKISYQGGDGNDVSIKLSAGSIFPWHNFTANQENDFRGDFNNQPTAISAPMTSSHYQLHQRQRLRTNSRKRRHRSALRFPRHRHHTSPARGGKIRSFDGDTEKRLGLWESITALARNRDRNRRRLERAGRGDLRESCRSTSR